MADEATIEYEIIGRALVRRIKCGHDSEEQHSLRLLYKGDGTPWWTCSAGLDMIIPRDFNGEPGDTIALTVKRIR